MSEAGRPGPSAEPAIELAAELIAVLAARDATVAVAESLTGGRLTAALTSIPGSSAVVRGAVVAYASSVKEQLLGVDPALLATEGAVSAEVAAQMARGARGLLDTVYGVATTGEAGPESGSGQPVGMVFVAVSGPRGTVTDELRADVMGQALGSLPARAATQEAAVLAALDLLRRQCAAPGPTVGPADRA